LDIPVFVVSDYENDKDAANAVDLKEVDFIIDVNNSNFEYNSKKLEYAISKYENNVLPPFFNTLADYVERGNVQFDCPGHQ
ncbi:ornithine decarboxylase, partial [Lactobacillus crispatus]|nr:ornithine decarboxylase [Lactobacillus crispatus]